MKANHKLCLTLLLLLTAWTARAQEPVVLTLEECIRTGLEENLQIKMMRNDERIAGNNATRAAAGMTPSLDLNGGYNAAYDMTSTRTSAGTSASQKSVDQTMTASVDLNWTLFDGFAMQTNLKRLRELQAQGEMLTRLQSENLIADITTEYYNFIQQRLRLKNLRYAVKLSRERLRIAQARFEVGKGSGLDLQQTSVDFNADSSQYIKQHELVETSRIRLNQLMNVKDVTRRIMVSDTLINVDETLQYAPLLESLQTHNTELKLAVSDERLSQTDLKLARASYYPYLKLNSGVGTSFRTYSDASNKHTNTWGPKIGLTVGFNLFDRNKRRQERNARIRQENAQLSLEQLDLELKADFNTLWNAYQNNLKVLRLERENERVAYNNYEIAYERYLLGDLSGIEMREAQKSLLDANERKLTAEYDTKSCEIALLRICGLTQSYLKPSK